MRAKIFFRQLFKFILIAAFIASIFIYPNWYKKQWHKVQGMYCVAQGDKYLRKAKFQKAINEYKKGLELYPEHYGAWFNLGNLYVVYEDYYSAIDAYTNAIKHNPNYVIARMNYGIISAEKLGDFDGAIEQYDKIIGIRRKLVYIPFVFNNLRSYKTNIGLAYYNKGVAYRQKSTYMDNRHEEKQAYLLQAIKAYQEASKILKKDYDTHYNLALAYHINGNYNLAGLTYCKAIKYGPLNYEAHYNLAVLLNHLKYYKEALNELYKANTLVMSRAEAGENQQKYMFNVMNDVTKEILKDESGAKYLTEDFLNDRTKTGTDIKLIRSKAKEKGEDLDKAFYEEMQACDARSIFRDEDNPEDEDPTEELEDYGE